MQRKKNNFVSTALSFEDFEKTLDVRQPATISADELVKENQALETEAKKKEAALKKAHQQQKRKNKKV